MKKIILLNILLFFCACIVKYESNYIINDEVKYVYIYRYDYKKGSSSSGSLYHNRIMIKDGKTYNYIQDVFDFAICKSSTFNDDSIHTISASNRFYKKLERRLSLQKKQEFIINKGEIKTTYRVRVLLLKGKFTLFESDCVNFLIKNDKFINYPNMNIEINSLQSIERNFLSEKEIQEIEKLFTF